MSDERTSTQPSAHVHFEHYCQEPGCRKWGSFGYDKGRGVTDWFCMQHRPETVAERGNLSVGLGSTPHI